MSQGPSIWRAIDRTMKGFVLIVGGLALALMTLLSVVNVLIMRKALNSPIQGAEDVLILALVFIVAVSIPFGARNGAHIEIEMIEPYMSPLVSRVSSIFVKIFGCGLLAIMAWRLWESGANASRFGETTQQLLISYEPFYYLLAVAIAAYAVILLLEIALLITGREIDRPDTEGDTL